MLSAQTSSETDGGTLALAVLNHPIVLEQEFCPECGRDTRFVIEFVFAEIEHIAVERVAKTAKVNWGSLSRKNHGGEMEYFVFANSFAAPFVSDWSASFIDGDVPLEALKKFVAEYKHPAGLYFAALYAGSDDYHKGRTPLVKWTCNHQLKLAEMQKKGACAFLVKKPGLIEIDGKEVEVEKPKDGSFEMCA